MDEEKVAQRFLKWSLNKKRTPALVVSGNEFVNYLSGNSKSGVYEFLKLNNLLGEYDVMCLTKNQGLFVCEVKSTFSHSKRLKEDAEKAWKQAMKDDLVFKAPNSDLDFIDTIPVYKLVAFPNLSRALFKDTLCSHHIGVCLFQEEFRSQIQFEKFVEYFQKIQK